MRAGVVCRLLFGNRYIKPYIITGKHRHAFAVFHAGAKPQRISFNAYGFNKMPFYINAIYFFTHLADSSVVRNHARSVQQRQVNSVNPAAVVSSFGAVKIIHGCSPIHKQN